MKKLIILALLIGLTLPCVVQAKRINMGQFKLTAYCPCSSCSEGFGRSTRSGHRARSNHTIATDPSVINMGSIVRIGSHTYVAEDCGSGVKGDHIDIFFDTHEEVEEFGVKHAHVWVERDPHRKTLICEKME